MYNYRPVQVVLYYSIVCTIAALCHTKYAQSLYLEVDQVAGLWHHCYVAVWECCWQNPVLSTYCIRTEYVLVFIQYMLHTYCVELVCTWYVLVHNESLWWRTSSSSYQVLWCASYEKDFLSAAPISESISFYFKFAVWSALTQESQLELETGPAESLSPSQSESAAWLLPDSAALTSEIFMTPPKR